MTFVDAAIELLKRAGEPLPVETLAELASSEGLLSRPSKNPVSTMKARLSVELKRGEESRVIKVEEGLFALSGATEAPAKKKRSRRSAGSNGKAAAAAEPAEAAEADEAAAERRPIEPQSDEEAALVELYADEATTEPAEERSEYSDELSADEDRPMLPAITADRGRSGRRSRRDRDRGRSRRDRGKEGKDGKEARAKEGREGRKERGDRGDRGDREAPRARPAEERGRDRDRVARTVVESLLDQVVEILLQVKDRSIPLAQASKMLRKRFDRSEGSAELEDMIRRAVLAGESAAARRRLEPEVVLRGNDRLGLGPREWSELRAAVRGIEQETRVALTHRLGSLSSEKLEVLVATYLERCGWSELSWIKRVEPSSYATATAPGQVEPTLVGVRAGGSPVDRRGVGELRAGVTAKRLPAGLLVAPQPLSPEARAELSKEGPPVLLLCGPPLVEALLDAGIGATPRTVSFYCLDETLFDRL